MTRCLVLFLLFIMASPLLSYNQVPKMVIFGLDNTLWPFWIGTHIQPPFKRNASGKLVDLRGELVTYYPEVPKVLEYLWKHYVGISIASKSEEMVGARRLLTLFGWSRYFKCKQIHPAICKQGHIYTISSKCNVELEDMLFFDADFNNISGVRNMGVVSVLVTNGMTMQLLMDGFKIYTDTKNKPIWVRKNTTDRAPLLGSKAPKNTHTIPNRHRTTTRSVLLAT